MNGPAASESRIAWTSTSLNYFLPIYKDLQDLQIQKENTTPKFISNALGNSHIMYQFIIRHISTTTVATRRSAQWNAHFWYDENSYNEDGRVEPPSTYLELAYSNVGDAYVKFQNTWDGAEEVYADDTDEDTY